MKMQRVYVVAFDPEEGGVGGFDWFYDPADAVGCLLKHIKDLPAGYRYTFCCSEAPLFPAKNALAQERITSFLDVNRPWEG